MKRGRGMVQFFEPHVTVQQIEVDKCVELVRLRGDSVNGTPSLQSSARKPYGSQKSAELHQGSQ